MATIWRKLLEGLISCANVYFIAGLFVRGILYLLRTYLLAKIATSNLITFYFECYCEDKWIVINMLVLVFVACVLSYSFMKNSFFICICSFYLIGIWSIGWLIYLKPLLGVPLLTEVVSQGFLEPSATKTSPSYPFPVQPNTIIRKYHRYTRLMSVMKCIKGILRCDSRKSNRTSVNHRR